MASNLEHAALGAPQTINISSNGIAPNRPIPREYTGYGENVSPQLKLTGVPVDAQFLAIVVDADDLASVLHALGGKAHHGACTRAHVEHALAWAKLDELVRLGPHVAPIAEALLHAQRIRVEAPGQRHDHCFVNVAVSSPHARTLPSSARQTSAGGAPCGRPSFSLSANTRKR